jgi:RNA-directed DNA polymerase
MTAVGVLPAGAASALKLDWGAINWRTITAEVRRLQLRIAKAFREGKYNKVKALQWLLTHSFSAKLLAVKRVVQNQGGKTPGIDGVVWNTPKKKLQAALSLKRRGYQAKPLKRIYIPKKQKGKFRPLSIPVMKCRGQQALHLLALEPIAEMLADKNAYGFRPLRSTADAIGQCFILLGRRDAAQYILEADIKDCFNSISQLWLQSNVIMDQEMLKKWLAAGYIEKGKWNPTKAGTAQGAVCSPALLNITLSGLEVTAKKAAPRRADKVHTCIYADDFIVTGAIKEVLEEKVKPAVELFLRERGLSFSHEKTKITHIDEGFDFLGMNIRKYKSKLIIKPAKSSVKRFLANIRKTIKSNPTTKVEDLIQQLNPKIRGWTNYYRHVCAKKVFSYVDNAIFWALWRWCKRRHPKKGYRWVKNRYFRSDHSRNWVFSAAIKGKDNKYLNLIQADKTPILRHVKIRAEANPYDPIYQEYLDKRSKKKESPKSLD